MGKFQDQYNALWARIKTSDKGIANAVGGDFETVGHIEHQLLKMLGLKPTHMVVDVGCGSGRLASQLSTWLKGGYLGTDILEDLLVHASNVCKRPDWRFEKTNGIEIPSDEFTADYVTFFSVLTHISHEDSFRYLEQAKRVLKPGGYIVCSFLEFFIRNHWTIFRMDLADRSPDKILNQFLSRDALSAFAFNLGLELVQFIDGNSECIPIEKGLVWESGVEMNKMASLGQSVCVLRKPLLEMVIPS